jgi:hypothetical protein
MTKETTMREMPKVRPLVGVVAALVFVVLAVGCGLVSDQGRQEAKKKVEAKGQQVPIGASTKTVRRRNARPFTEHRTTRRLDLERIHEQPGK